MACMPMYKGVIVHLLHPHVIFNKLACNVTRWDFIVRILDAAGIYSSQPQISTQIPNPYFTLLWRVIEYLANVFTNTFGWLLFSVE